MPLPDVAILPDTLRPERLQLHYAARLLASTAHSLLDHARDDSHSNLGLDSAGTHFATHPLAADNLTLRLEIETLQLSWMLGGSQREARLLSGSTMADAYQWLNATRPSGTPNIVERSFPDFPEHALGAGAAFEAGDAARRTQLGRYFALGQHVMDRLAASDSGVSARRVWPHHFDIGALISVASAAGSIGLGLSPGDHYYEEPYFYISAYPSPSAEKLPSWDDVGHWHTKEFTSLVVTATEWQSSGEAADSTSWRVVQKAVALSKGLLAHGNERS